MGVRQRLGKLEREMGDAELYQLALELAVTLNEPFPRVLAEVKRWVALDRVHGVPRVPGQGWDIEPTIRAYYVEEGLQGADLHRQVLAFVEGLRQQCPDLVSDIRRDDYEIRRDKV